VGRAESDRSGKLFQNESSEPQLGRWGRIFTGCCPNGAWIDEIDLSELRRRIFSLAANNIKGREYKG
jgi:hypothetical protein